jgi:1-acyl-sn-glycerol-3-phosphate acyltransferase
MTRLDTFVAPRPNPVVMTMMTYVNRFLIVGGIPGLKYLRPRPLTRITEVYFSAADQAKLRALVNAEHTAVFITPNHPEFFTDWMLDKCVLSLVAPRAASWATHKIVNGMGALGQWFWLSNNLIAQIPRLSETAKRHSIKVAAGGDGVLLHPEGAVGWHSNYIGPLFPGAVDMAQSVQELDPLVLASYVAPVVWKIVFTADVTDGLWSEYQYICRQLRIKAERHPNPALSVYHLYEELLARDEAMIQVIANRTDSVRVRIPLYLGEATAELAELVFTTETGVALLRIARQWLQNNRRHDPDKVRSVQRLIASIERWQKFSTFAWRSNVTTQEEVAEHQKRIRTEFCTGGLRNTLNAFVPIAVGPRQVDIRVLEPILVPKPAEAQSRSEKIAAAGEITELLRLRLQEGIDALNAELNNCFTNYPNPFL